MNLTKQLNTFNSLLHLKHALSQKLSVKRCDFKVKFAVSIL